MAVLHRDFIKAIQSLVFDYCGIFGCAKVLRDMPFKSETERKNLLCLCINRITCVNSDLNYAKTYDIKTTPGVFYKFTS